MDNNPKVAILMGSDSDLEIMKDAAKVLEEFGIGYEMTIASAHRTTERLLEFAKGADKRGIEVIIAGAGGAAHAPGMAAAVTPLPVIGVPILAKSTAGLDSLLSIVQMPSGIPVATMAINGAKNAGIFAAEILGVKYPEIKEKILDHKKTLKEKVEKKAQDLEQMGYAKYLEQKSAK
jgi:5-(carboxyamino)imidazole ribonucleotide mutase